jgi:hypothetical protein
MGCADDMRVSEKGEREGGIGERRSVMRFQREMIGSGMTCKRGACGREIGNRGRRIF